MPTVPTEQNRVGIAGLTDASLQPGDYSGTGLQALGAGMRTLGAAGAESAETMARARKIAAGAPRQPVAQDAAAQAIDTTSHEALHASMLPPSPEEIRDDAICKIGWNQFSDVCRGVWKELEGQKGFDAVLKVEPAIEALNAEYKRGLGMLPAELHPVYEGSVGARLPMEVAGLQAFGAAQSAVEQDRQSLLAQQNAADDAVRHAENPDMFDRHVETGAGSIATQGALRGDDPATIDGAISTYRSGINRRVLEQMTEKDPTATAVRYGAVRQSMTPDDQLAVEKGLFEPLARAQAASDVDRFLPQQEPGQPPSPLSPEARAAAREAIEAEPWNEARKRYALDDLAERGSMQERSRKQAEDAARDTGFAIADQLGSGFKSISQLPATVRRDLDEETNQALRNLAQANVEPEPVAAGGEVALMMNIIASENPATFAKEDLRLIRGRVTPEEYDRLVRLRQWQIDLPTAGNATARHRIMGMFSTYGSVGMFAPNDPRSAHSRDISELYDRRTGAGAYFIKTGQDGGSFGQDRAVAWELARRHGDDPEKVQRDMLGFPRRELTGPRTLTPLHKHLKELAEKYPPDPGTPEWDTAKAIEWKTVGGRAFIFDFKDKWVHGYRRAIVAAAREFDLPPELVAGVAYNEVGGDPSWADAAAFNIRGRKEKRRTSFGSLSLQVRSASDTLGYTSPGSWQDAAIIGSLNNSQENIFIAAKFLARLRNIDFKSRSAKSLLKDDIAVIASRYNRGPGLSLDKIKEDTQYGKAIIKRIDHIKSLLK